LDSSISTGWANGDRSQEGALVFHLPLTGCGTPYPTIRLVSCISSSGIQQSEYFCVAASTGKVKNIALPLLLLYTFLAWCLYPGTTFFYSAMNLSPAK